MPRLALAKDLSQAEQRQLISWQDPPAWSSAATNDAPPGRGNFMIKIGGRPGIPFRVTLTRAEERLHDTNKQEQWLAGVPVLQGLDERAWGPAPPRSTLAAAAVQHRACTTPRPTPSHGPEACQLVLTVHRYKQPVAREASPARDEHTI